MGMVYTHFPPRQVAIGDACDVRHIGNKTTKCSFDNQTLKQNMTWTQFLRILIKSVQKLEALHQEKERTAHWCHVYSV
jgi:hypothetical protein